MVHAATSVAGVATSVRGAAAVGYVGVGAAASAIGATTSAVGAAPSDVATVERQRPAELPAPGAIKFNEGDSVPENFGCQEVVRLFMGDASGKPIRGLPRPLNDEPDIHWKSVQGNTAGRLLLVYNVAANASYKLFRKQDVESVMKAARTIDVAVSSIFRTGGGRIKNISNFIDYVIKNEDYEGVLTNYFLERRVKRPRTSAPE